MVSKSVAIFWDYENCALPALEAPHEIVNRIRTLAHQYGGVKTFKAYLEYPEQISPRSMALRSELQSCGVSLIDTPHNGRKDVADKMIMVDMMAYAMDTPVPTTIFLISGDRDFVYAISILALRQYHVVLLAPKSAHSSLKEQAGAHYLWPDHFMTNTPRPSELPSASISRANIASTLPNGVTWPPLSTARSSLATIPTYQPPPIYSPGDSSRNQYPIKNDSPIRDEIDRAASSTGDRTFGIAKAVPEAVTPARLYGLPPKPSARGDLGVAAREPGPSTSTEVNKRPPPLKTSAPSSPTTEGRRPTLSEVRNLFRPSAIKSRPSSPPGSTNTESATSSISDASTPTAPAPLSATRVPFVPPRAGLSATAPAYTPLASTLFGADRPKAVPSRPISPAPPSVYDSNVVRGSDIPEEFRPLVRVLKAQYAEGHTSVEASQLGTLLRVAQVARGGLGALYGSAGVSRLREYTKRAEEEGIVRIAPVGVDGGHNVTLRWSSLVKKDA